MLGGVDIPEDLLARFQQEQLVKGIPSSAADVITTIFNDPNLSVEQKSRRSGLLIDQLGDRSAALTSIGDFIQQRQDLDTLLALPDSKLLGDNANFVQPVRNYDQQPTGPDRMVWGMAAAADQWYEENGEPSAVFVAEALDLQVAMVTATGEFDIGFELATLAQRTGEQINVEGLANVIDNAFGNAVTKEQVFDNALQETSFVAGSDQLSDALYQTALNLFNEPGALQLLGGFDPAVMANMFASSTDLHMIIDVVSGGLVGGPTRGGSISGIGGLTTRAYATLVDGGYEAVKNDTEGELRALILYILESFGTPDVAVNNYLNTGEWGN